eukprot:1263083-Pleurochrysis_carterae.AAC.1
MRRVVVVDDDDNDDDDDDDVGDGESDAWTERMLFAKYLDDFFACVYAVRPFERDDTEYRKERALALFNA